MKRSVGFAAIALAVAGCTTSTPPSSSVQPAGSQNASVGQTVIPKVTPDQVSAVIGQKPTTVQTLPNGSTRLEYDLQSALPIEVTIDNAGLCSDVTHYLPTNTGAVDPTKPLPKEDASTPGHDVYRRVYALCYPNLGSPESSGIH
jgi:hypothetical protein